MENVKFVNCLYKPVSQDSPSSKFHVLLPSHKPGKGEKIEMGREIKMTL
jgi:hypothetical protein